MANYEDLSLDERNRESQAPTYFSPLDTEILCTMWNLGPSKLFPGCVNVCDLASEWGGGADALVSCPNANTCPNAYHLPKCQQNSQLKSKAHVQTSEVFLELAKIGHCSRKQLERDTDLVYLDIQGRTS